MFIRGNRPLSDLNLWSIRSVLALEPFISMTIDPGSEFTWEVYLPVLPARAESQMSGRPGVQSKSQVWHTSKAITPEETPHAPTRKRWAPSALRPPSHQKSSRRVKPPLHPFERGRTVQPFRSVNRGGTRSVGGGHKKRALAHGYSM